MQSLPGEDQYDGACACFWRGVPLIASAMCDKAGLLQMEQRNVGVAVMEVFVRKDSEGIWQRQACVASPSAETQQQAAQSMPFPGGAALLLTYAIQCTHMCLRLHSSAWRSPNHLLCILCSSVLCVVQEKALHLRCTSLAMTMHRECVWDKTARRGQGTRSAAMCCLSTPCVNDRSLHAGMPPALDIHVDNGVPGEDVISMRISLGSNGQPTISDSNAASIEDMLQKMLSPDSGTTRSHSAGTLC